MISHFFPQLTARTQTPQLLAMTTSLRVGLVFPLRLENAASSGRVLRAAVSPLDGQIDGQTAWAGVMH